MNLEQGKLRRFVSPLIDSLVLVVLVNVNISVALFFNTCPNNQILTLRTQDICGIEYKYMYLYDTNEHSFRELCDDEHEFHRPGHCVVMNGNVQNLSGKPCYNNRYKPHAWWTNSSGECQYLKSTCNGEGQVPYDNGIVTRNRIYRCDYANYYTFVNSSIHKCFCDHTEEDCSCYWQRCYKNQVLTPDYDCVGGRYLTASFVCPNYKPYRITDDKKLQQSTICPELYLSCILQQAISSRVASWACGFVLILGLISVAFVKNRNLYEVKKMPLSEISDCSIDMDNVFRKNESQIVNVLGNQDKDEGRFSPMQVVNNKMNNTILQGNKKEQPTRRIANTLLYLERKDEDTLYRVFIDTYKARLRKELELELTKYTTAVEDRKNKTEPKKWPPMIDEQLGMLQDPIILIKDPTRGSFIQEYGQENVYKIQGKCRGKVFIINNVNFDRRVRDRNGSNIDAENLRKLFRDLHFKVHQQDNLTANDMKYFLQNEAQNLDKEYCTECIILIIMSHGRGTRVFGVDWVPVELKTLTQYFSSDNCPILHGKPRLVFVQACRLVDEVFIEKTLYSVNIGVDVKIDCVIKTVKPVEEVFWEKNSKGYKPVYINANSAKYLLQNSQSNKSLTIRKAEISDQGRYRCIVKYDQYEQSNATELTVYEKDYSKNDFSNKYEQLKIRPGQLKDSEPSPCESKEPSLQQNSFFDHPSADFLIAYATPEGAMAWLNNEVGSWFMNAIVWTFKYHAHEEELHQLLIRVNRLVGKGRTRSNDTTVAEMTSNLRKKFYFFPGIHSNPPVLFSD